MSWGTCYSGSNIAQDDFEIALRLATEKFGNAGDVVR